MRRVLVPPDALRGDIATVTDPQELHHLLRVLRVKPGDPIECLDGAGARARGTIRRCRADQIVIALEERLAEPVVALRVTLAQSLIKLEHFDWAIQKATELGVDRIVPLITARTVVKIRAEGAERKRLRWQRIAAEAAKQCGRARLPQIDAPQPFAAFAEGIEAGQLTLLATLAGSTVPMAQALRDAGACLTIAIGPEGDFTPEESRLAQRRGAVAVSLGAHTLRSETAAVAALAMVQYHQMITQDNEP